MTIPIPQEMFMWAVGGVLVFGLTVFTMILSKLWSEIRLVGTRSLQELRAVRDRLSGEITSIRDVEVKTLREVRHEDRDKIVEVSHKLQILEMKVEDLEKLVDDVDGLQTQMSQVQLVLKEYARRKRASVDKIAG